MISANRITVPEELKAVLSRLARNGYEAYVVGGCVRDCLLGKEPSDWDVCSASTPEETERCFSDCRVILTGARHGTVAVIFNGRTVEITTFRTDGQYIDHRRPESVSFSRTLRDDLARRDFTVNAMAADADGNVIDIYSGVKDLESHVLRAVGAPLTRFGEDALRILRALRFASVYGFALERETANAAKTLAELLREISAERINAELIRLLGGAFAARIWQEYADIFAVILPETLLTQTENVAKAIELSERDTDMTLLQLGLFIGTSWMVRLKFDRATLNRCATICEFAQRQLPETRPQLLKWLGALGEKDLLTLLAARSVFSCSTGLTDNAAALLPLAERLTKEKPCCKVSMLAINGDDIISLGIRDGKTVGSTLRHLLEAVIDGELKNERVELLEAATRLNRKGK